MNPTLSLDNHIIAIDVGKYELEVATIPPSAPKTISNTKAAILKLLKAEQRRNKRQNLPPILLICEATGGYELLLLGLAFEMNIISHRAEGRRVRLFAQAQGLRAKTDPLDAAIIAAFAEKTDCSMSYVPPAPAEKALMALVKRRGELLNMKLAEQRRQEHSSEKVINKSRCDIIKMLQKQILLIEKEMANLVSADAKLAHKNSLLQSLIGVGPITARTLMATMPELGSLSKGQVASLIGLAPYNRDSGQTNLRRHICAGRFQARRCLFMAATVSIAKNPILKRKFQDLTAMGKPYKVALVAIMRKIIVILNAILKTNEPWKGLKAS